MVEEESIQNNTSSTDATSVAPVVSVQSDDLITKANAAAMRMEEANKVMAANIARQEALLVEKTLSGKTTAGEPVKKESSDEDYAKKVMANDL